MGILPSNMSAERVATPPASDRPTIWMAGCGNGASGAIFGMDDFVF